jgi:hypothetical protein
MSGSELPYRMGISSNHTIGHDTVLPVRLAFPHTTHMYPHRETEAEAGDQGGSAGTRRRRTIIPFQIPSLSLYHMS